jgi:hypothetical protein
LFVENAKSLSGIRVNGKTVQQAQLKHGDTLQFAEFEFQVRAGADAWELMHQVDAKSDGSNESLLAKQIENLSVHNFLPSKIKAAVFASVLLLLGFFAYPISGGSKMSWSSGELSKGHQLFEQSCETCHAGNFKKVADESCLACHSMHEHAQPNSPDKSLFVQQCADCHMEHNGATAPKLAKDALCLDCHAKIKCKHPDSCDSTFVSWETHREFSVRVPNAESQAFSPRISLANTPLLTDRSGIKLNHALHLQPKLRGPEGEVQLTCQSCHRLAADNRSMQPINMERDCKACHSLGFDSRLPDLEVPHANSDLVYSFLFSNYASFLLTDEGTALPSGFQRKKPGAEELGSSPTQVAFARAEVEKEARNAEKELFTRTACVLCHEVAARELPLEIINSDQRSAYETVKPLIPQSWMPGARFNHGSHETMKCIECHAQAEKSEVTSDVLLPPVANCQQCHASAVAAHKVQTSCVDCHSFHDEKPLEVDKKRSTHELIKGLQK